LAAGRRVGGGLGGLLAGLGLTARPAVVRGVLAATSAARIGGGLAARPVGFLGGGAAVVVAADLHVVRAPDHEVGEQAGEGHTEHEAGPEERRQEHVLDRD